VDLSLSGLDFDYAACRRLAEGLQQNNSLQSLRLSGSDLAGLATVMIEARVLRGLRRFTIVDGACRPEVLLAFASAPHSLPRLEVLDLSNNGLTLDSALSLEIFLSQWAGRTAYLSNNLFNDRAMVPLTRAVLVNKSLTELSLFNNPVNREGGFVFLAGCLRPEPLSLSLPNHNPETRKFFAQVEAVGCGKEDLSSSALKILLPEFLAVCELFQPSILSLRGCFLGRSHLTLRPSAYSIPCHCGPGAPGFVTQ
jgi:hypothetical protein